MLRREEARPHGWQATGRAATTAVEARLQPDYTTPVALAVRKRDRLCVVGKLVEAQPIGCLVLAMPYRHRQTVEHVSVPPAVLAYARRAAARWWVVRLDGEGRCLGLPLGDVEPAGWLKPSGGRPEWFVPLARFRPLPWQTWHYVERVVVLDAEADDRPQQLELWGVG